MELSRDYEAYGTFKVTTQADCEGRTTKELGVYTGFIDNIALALADRCYYTLIFTKVEVKQFTNAPKASSVTIQLDIDSGTWDLHGNDALNYFRKLFRNRDVFVKDIEGNGKCVISTERETVEDKRDRALAKLTAEERELLGLSGESLLKKPRKKIDKYRN